MKYKEGRKLITLNCDYCGCSYEKPLSEYNRNQQFGRHSFCSRSCAMKFLSNNRTQVMKDYSNSEKNNMKNTMSDSDTRLMCKYIAEHFCSEGTISSPCITA